MKQVTLRCAIYTRKSTEEGLEQAFNSLDAQREACEAYIKSQGHEGWRLVDTAYDDGGFSGGSMVRPALGRLLADIKLRRVDVVMVYKVDRLTRSLADFAKIVEILDSSQASFVSITQQFNTTTSMGRLTLNVLLSFAQFEREVTGERIRDKIAASKRRGMWMGGSAPLGYDVREKKLVINQSEAKCVRGIFRRYLELGTVVILQADLRRQGIASKVWTSRSGNHRGGMPYSRGALYYLLRNPIYVGKIAHNGALYAGQHAPILDEELWQKVQDQLVANRNAKGASSRRLVSSPLSGLLFDDRGNLMTPSHTKKSKGQRYRYYISQSVLQNEEQLSGSISRVPAALIERLVAESAKQRLRGSSSLEDNWHKVPSPLSIRDVLERVVVSNKSLEILFTVGTPKRVILAGVFVREGRGLTFRRFSQGSSGRTKRASTALVKALCRAHHWLQLIESGQVKSYYELARTERMNPGYVRRILQLAFLSPQLVEAILASRPLRFNGVMELTDAGIPLSWQRQEEKLLQLEEH